MSSLSRLTVLLGVLAILAFVAMLAVGMPPILPWTFILGVALLPPEAWAVAGGLSWLGERGLTPAWSLVVGISAGGALLVAEALHVTSGAVGQGLLMVLFLVRLLGIGFESRHQVALQGLAALIVGQLAVLAANYLALREVGGVLHDQWAHVIDQRIYGALGLWRDLSLFPLVPRGLWFAALERAYVFMFPELAIVLFLLANDIEQVRVYIARIFACYAAALCVFVCWPVVGPGLMYPESIGRALDGTIMGVLSHNQLLEFRNIVGGGVPSSGFGVFVAFPSVHVALAVLFQWSVRALQVARWALHPINLLLVFGTVALGQHYLIDVPAGILLGAAVILVVRPRTAPELA